MHCHIITVNIINLRLWTLTPTQILILCTQAEISWLKLKKKACLMIFFTAVQTTEEPLWHRHIIVTVMWLLWFRICTLLYYHNVIIVGFDHWPGLFSMQKNPCQGSNQLPSSYEATRLTTAWPCSELKQWSQWYTLKKDKQRPWLKNTFHAPLLLFFCIFCTLRGHLQLLYSFLVEEL